MYVLIVGLQKDMETVKYYCNRWKI